MREKKIIAAAVIAASLFTGSVTAVDACGVGVSQFKVDTAMLNVRKGPGTTYAIMGKAKKGQEFVPTEAAKNGEWGKIKLTDGKTGWVCMKYMKEINCPELTNQMAKTKVVLNVRKGKSTKSKRLWTLKKGEMVEVLEKGKTWTYIEHKKNGRYSWGYVATKYLNFY